MPPLRRLRERRDKRFDERLQPCHDLLPILDRHAGLSQQLPTPRLESPIHGRLPAWFTKTPKRMSHKTLDLIKTNGQ